MVAGNLQYLGLEHYLRLVNAAPPEWLAGLAHFTGGPDLTLCTRPQGFSGTLSWLTSPAVGVAVIGAGAEATLYGTNTADPATIIVLRGRVSLNCGNVQIDAGAGDGFFLPPHASATISGSQDLQLVLARLSQCGNGPCSDEASVLSPDLVSHMLCYLRRAHFFRSHQHALAETDRLGEVLRQYLCQAPEVSPLHLSPMPAVDRRVIRMVELIASDAERDFNADRISALAGVSTRNLYYLMRKHTGMSPYQFFVSRRLVRVRRALLDCQCDAPTVSWHALSEGFSHLGRFSALYRRHFGEYPRQTLEWRNQARARAADIQPAGCSESPLMMCLEAG
ncbi:AraC family transcriptional regulator [Marinobacter sp.]|uniref:AraC family transcriptional regulator n=1 Tax=Marinobacter sp. TaxID=50741 RepID=UPI0035613B42